MPRRKRLRSIAPKKIFWITTVLVLIPSIFLCYFGVQTIIEQRGMETLFEEKRFQAVSENLVEDIYSAIRTQIDLVNAKLEGFNPEGMSREHISGRLASLEDEHLLFSRIFLFNNDGALFYPAGYYVATDSIPVGFGEIIENIIIERKLREGELLETSGRLEQAISIYRSLAENEQDTHVQAIALNSLARCHGLRGESASAAKTYKIVAERFSDVMDLNGIRLGLLARYQGARFCEAQGDFRGAVEQLLALLEDVGSGRWSDIRGQEIFYANKALQRLDGLTVSKTGAEALYLDKARCRTVRAAVERRIAEYRDVVRFHSKIKPRLLVSQPQPGEQFSALRFPGQRTGDGDAVLTQLVLSNGRYRVGLLFSESALADFMSLSIERAVKAHDDIEVAISSNSGRRIAGTGALGADERPLYSATLAKTFPFYRIDLFRASSPSAIYAERDRAIRIGMIGAFIILIGIGSYFTFRSLAREAEIVKMKSDFVSNVTHELKTPLTTLKMIGEMLEMGAVPSQERRQDYYRTIASESERLTQLINNVLDFSRIEAGGARFEFEHTDISPLVSESVNAFQSLVQRNGFTISTAIASDLPPVLCDAGAVSHALVNLLDNAVKYSNGTGVVKVAASRDGADVAIRVADQGVGIPKAELARIFDKFYRGKAGDDPERKGIGLGLTLVREIVEAHGGAVEVESSPGHGSVFTMKFPIDQEENSGANSRR